MSTPEEVHSQPIQPEYLTRKEAAAFARIPNVRILDKLNKNGLGPPKLKVTRKLVLYEKHALIEWLNSHQVSGPALARPRPKRGRPFGSKSKVQRPSDARSA